jgi:hypothetical protein
MVRTYKRKTDGPGYTEEDLKNALQRIQIEKWSYRRASTDFNIPLSTLSSHVLRTHKPNRGHPPALSRKEEEYLVKLIVTLQEWGQLSTCNDVLKYTHEYIEIMDFKSRFVNGSPTKDWYYGFIKRWNNDLKVMFSSSLENARAKGVTPDVIDGWFNVLNGVLTKLNLHGKPQNIFNTDESGFCEEVGRRVVVVKRGTKYASQ